MTTLARIHGVLRLIAQRRKEAWFCLIGNEEPSALGGGGRGGRNQSKALKGAAHRRRRADPLRGGKVALGFSRERQPRVQRAFLTAFQSSKRAQTPCVKT
jgi:hypothetical protein